MQSSASALAAARSPDDIRSEIMALVEEYTALVHGRKPFVPGRSDVAVAGRIFDARDVKALVDSALDFWLTTGRFNARFEADLAKRIGSRAPIGCSLHP